MSDSNNKYITIVSNKNTMSSKLYTYFVTYCFVDVKSLWRPEYGAYMLEGTPGKPYGGLLAHFNIVEANMKYRRAEASTLLKDGEVIMSITNFPRYEFII